MANESRSKLISPQKQSIPAQVSEEGIIAASEAPMDIADDEDRKMLNIPSGLS